jgi:hypothetical protein
MASGETTNGTCATLIARAADGLLTLDEEWRWESKSGRGRALLREVV